MVKNLKVMDYREASKMVRRERSVLLIMINSRQQEKRKTKEDMS